MNFNIQIVVDIDGMDQIISTKLTYLFQKPLHTENRYVLRYRSLPVVNPNYDTAI